MTGPEAVAIVGAGLAAGTVNAVVGSGTLIAFPVLLALGYPPVAANVSTTIGLVPGALSGAYGCRRELAGQRGRLIRLGLACVLGGVTGAVLLTVLPAAAFATVVPVLLLAAGALIVLQPHLAILVRHRDPTGHGGPLLWLGIYAVGVYGGYFGAAQGVLAVAMMGMAFADSVHRLNAIRNVLSLLAYAAAAGVFLATADVSWFAVALLAGGAIVGGPSALVPHSRYDRARYADCLSASRR